MEPAADQCCGSHAGRRPLLGVGLFRSLAEVEDHRGRESHRHLVGSRAVRAEDPRLASDWIDRAGAALDERHAVLEQVAQQRVARIEGVDRAQRTLVGIASLVLVEHRGDVSKPGQPCAGMRVDEARGGLRRSQLPGAFRRLYVCRPPHGGDAAVLNVHDGVGEGGSSSCV